MSIFFFVMCVWVGLVLLLFGLTLIRGREVFHSLFVRRATVGLVCVALLSLTAYTFYNEYLLKNEISYLQRMNDSLAINQNTIDSLLTEEGGKDILIDSLSKKNVDLEKLLNNVVSYQRIAGKGRSVPIIEKAQVEVEQTEIEIKKVESYNEILSKSSVKDALSKGYAFSGETNYFTFFPPLDTDGMYLDFSLKFIDDRVVDRIAVIYVEIVRLDDQGHFHELYSSFYKPQIELNHFKVYNYLKQKGSRMLVGFFWKDEFGVINTPRYEKTTYILNP